MSPRAYNKTHALGRPAFQGGWGRVFEPLCGTQNAVVTPHDKPISCRRCVAKLEKLKEKK